MCSYKRVAVLITTASSWEESSDDGLIVCGVVTYFFNLLSTFFFSPTNVIHGYAMCLLMPGLATGRSVLMNTYPKRLIVSRFG